MRSGGRCRRSISAVSYTHLDVYKRQPQYGARPLRRLIQTEVEDRFSEALLDRIVEEGDTAVVDLDVDAGRLIIEKKVSHRKKSDEQDDEIASTSDQ